MVEEELIAAANNAAVMVRAPNFNPMAIGTMYAAAQRAMGAHHDENFRDTPQSLHDEGAALPLIAAARTLHTIAISQSVRNTDRPITVRTTLLAATAYAMHGNLPSAAAVLRDIADDELQSEAQAVTVAICVPSSVGQLLAGALPFSQNGRTFLELLNRYLLTGEEAMVPDISSKIDELSLSSGDVFDMVLMANCRVALAHVIHLSVSRRVSPTSDLLMKEFAQKLVSKGRPCLLPSQFALLVGKQFANETENLIVTLPTSGGKTLLAEFAIVRALAPGPGIALYVVPYNALGNQVYDTLLQHLPGDITVHRLFGGFKGATLAVGISRHVVIATPERADALLRSGDFYTHLRIAVFDEAHVIENGARGARVEAIIARLRMKQTAGANYRIVLLSAVLSEVSALCSWLGPNAKHYTNPWRPTARRIAVWESNGSLNWLYGNDPLRPTARSGGDSLVRNPLPWPIPLYPAEEFARIKAQLPAAFANVSYLGSGLIGS
jgi:helicase